MNHEPNSIDAILAEAVKLESVDERERYLDEACGDDSRVRREVAELVDVHFSIDQLFQNPTLAGFLIAKQGEGLDGTTNVPPAHSLLGHGGVLGDYQLVRQIGRGGMGVVYEAEQISLKRRVALKVLPFAAVLDQRQLQRFKTEAQAAAGLHHGNIVPVYQVGCERAVHFYAMQYIEGQDVSELIDQLRKISNLGRIDMGITEGSDLELASQLATGAFPIIEPTTRIGYPANPKDDSEAESSPHCPPWETELSSPTTKSTMESVTKPEFFRTIAGLGIQAAEALEYAHQRGVLHRDVKPSNLMLDAYGKLWITDFGLARIEGDAGLTMTGDVMGTLRYMSPEQAGGRNAIVDQRSDVYSLGVTLYEMLTLRPIYAGCDRNELLLKRAQEEPVPPRQIKKSLPTDLETIVLTAIAKKPDDRYATAQELADDLRRFLENKPILAKRPSMVKRVTKWGQRHRSLSASLIVLLIAALISGTVVFGVISGNIRNPPLDGTPGHETSRYKPLGLTYPGEFLPGLVPEPTSVTGIGLWQMVTKRPRGVMQSGVFSPDERMIAVGESGNIRIYDAANFRLLQILVGHTGHVTSVAWHPSSRQLASASWDGTVRLWTADGTPTHVLNGHVGEVNCVAWHPDGTQLASAGAKGTVRLWNMDGTNAGLLRSHRDHVFCLAYSPDGKMLASAGGDILPPDENDDPGDNAIRLWNLAEKRVTALLEGHDLTVRCLAWRPDGLKLATGSGNVFRSQGPTRRDTGTLRLWNTDGTAGPVVPGNFRGIHALAWHPNGRQIVFGGRQETIWSWDKEQPTLATKFRIHGTDVNTIAWDSAGMRLLTTSRASMIIWKTNGVPRLTLDGLLQGPRFTCVDFSPDGRWITSRGRLWRSDGTPGPILNGAQQPVVWSPNGKWLAAAGPNTTVKLWDENFSPSRLLSKHDRYITALGWASDSMRVASTGGDGTTHVWDLNSNTTKILQTVDQTPRQFRSVAFSPDGRSLAAASWGDAAVHVWDQMGNIRALLKGHRSGVESVDWSPNGRQLVTGGGLTVRLWKPDGTLNRVLIGHTNEVYPVAYSPDGRWFASGSTDGTVRLWHANGNPGPVLRGHYEGIHSLAWSPDSKRLASASWLDGTLRMWNIDTQKTEWMLLLLDDAGTTVTLSPSGELLHGDREVAAEELLYLRETATGKVSTLTFDDFHDKHADEMMRHFGDLGWKAVRRGEFAEAVARCHQMTLFGNAELDSTLHNLVADVVGELLSAHQQEYAVPIMSDLIQFDRKLIEAHPDKAQYKINLINDLAQRHDLFSHLERYEEALADIKQMLILDPKNAQGYYYSSEVHCHMGQYDLAIVDYKKTIELAPDYSAALAGYALALADHPVIHKRDPEQAIVLARRALAITPKWELVWNVLGLAQYRSGNWQAAIEAYQQAIKLSKTRGQSNEFFFLAMAYWQLGDKEAATAWYHRGVEWMERKGSRDSKNSDIIRWRAETAELLGIGERTAQP